MILTEALHPSLTRSGAGYSHYLPVTGFTAEDFAKSQHDLWLPPLEVSAKELNIIKNLAKKAIYYTHENNQGLVGSSVLDEKTGCWVPETGMSEDKHLEVLWDVAEYDAKGVLDIASLAVKQQIQLCDEPNCLNPRHYDFTPRLKTRWELLKPDRNMFFTQPDGTIKTAWDSVLPSVQDSIKELRKLQISCHPYVSERDGALTANSVSKITIDEHTGCWPARSYYTRRNNENLEIDGYGRLYPRASMRGFGRQGDALAHRVAWVATGRRLPPRNKELNHICGFRPCTNPLHMEVVRHSQNVNHSYEMRNGISLNS